MESGLKYKEAKIYPFSLKEYCSIEFPGYVKDVNKVYNMLGGMESICQAFKDSSVLELRYRPSSPFCHPINGEIMKTVNPLLKITRRRKKPKKPGDKPGPWEISYKIVGVVTKVGRFRGMSDYQVIPKFSYDMPKLAKAIKDLDVGKLESFKNITDNNKNELCNIPAPVFTSIEWPQNYGYLQLTSVVKVFVKKKDQEPVLKLINRSKKTKLIIATVDLSDPNCTIPTTPPAAVAAHSKYISSTYINEIAELFDKRPIWSRIALVNNLSEDSVKRIKQLLPLVSYTVVHGAFRDCWIKYGVDPRISNDFRIYQTMDIRNIKGPRPLNRAKRHNINESESSKLFLNISLGQNQPKENKPKRNVVSHIFNGKVFSGNIIYQLCDLSDSKLKKMVNTKKGLLKEFNDRDGWYSRQQLDKIREELRKKVQKLLEDNNNNENVDDIESDYEESEEEEEEEEENEAEQSANTTESINKSIKELMKNLSVNNNVDNNNNDMDDDDDDYYNDVFGDDGDSSSDSN